MTKKQKIWLSVSGLMFILPELLWSPIVNTYYYLFNFSSVNKIILRNNFLFDYKYESLLKLVITIQLIGIVYVFIFLCKKTTKFKFKPLIIIITLALLIITGFAFYLWVLFNIRW
jgi:hypothetical protein